MRSRGHINGVRGVSAENEAGFTIVELMIALSVLSVILVVSTVILIQIGRLYTKGVNMANLQNTTRTVANDITSNLQFSGNGFITSPTTGSETLAGQTVVVNAICIGTTRYTYILQHELGTDSATSISTPHVLWRDTINNGGGCLPLKIDTSDPNTDSVNSASTAGDGYEMLGDRMSLDSLSVTPSSSGAFNVKVWLAFGDSDLVNYSKAGNPLPTCNGDVGTEFCAVSEYNAYATQRL